MKTWSTFAIAAVMASGLSLTACSNNEENGEDSPNAEKSADNKNAGEATQSIVDIAVGDENFSTLVSLLKKAGLVETLQGEGPFTVFAPTNAAFEKVDQATLDALGEDTELLKSVLLYHVVSGAKVMAADAMKLSEAEMASGKKASVETKDGSVYVAGAKVAKVDIAATNGVIHVIDSVMMPPQ